MAPVSRSSQRLFFFTHNFPIFLSWKIPSRLRSILIAGMSGMHDGHHTLLLLRNKSFGISRSTAVAWMGI